MKFGKVGQIVLVSTIALLVASLFTACGTLNVGFMFVAANRQTPGQIQVYEVDSESGSIRTIPTSPFPSGGRNPIAEAASSDSKNLYVANQDDNNIVQFGIGTDGKLYPSSTVNTPGSFPLAIALNATHTYLYAVNTLQPIPGCTLGNPCPGNLFVCPVNSDASLGTPINGTNQCTDTYNLQLTPSDTKTILTPLAINVLANGQYLYVSATNPTTNQGYIFGFAVNSDGTLTSMNGGLPYSLYSNPAGQSTSSVLKDPVALTSDSTGSNLFVADKLSNLVSTFAIGANGTLSTTGVATSASAVVTGNQPSALTLYADKFVYVTNSGDSTVASYTLASGVLTNLATNASDTQPIAIMVDPKQVGFLYTVNFLGNTLSGYQINPTSGALINTQNTPYASLVQPTAIAGIPHGGVSTKTSSGSN